MENKLDELALRKEWMEEARKMTLENLPKFIEKLLNYEHEYGTIPRAIAFAGVAAAYAIQNSPQGNITSFQAGCVLMDMICGWDKSYEEGFSIRRDQDMLYPQYEYKFKSLSKGTFEILKEKAKNLLEKHKEKPCHPNVMAHWKWIVDGNTPFNLTLSDD